MNNLTWSQCVLHKGGIHISAVLKDNRTYEHLNPLLVGNDRNIKISELAGKSSIIYKAKQFGIPLAEGNPKIDQILKVIKEKERQGILTEGRTHPRAYHAIA